MNNSFDVLIIGGGPGGYVAAIRAGQLGLRTALVEKTHLGGICLNWGCIPTKAMLHGAEVGHAMRHADRLGFSVGEIAFEIRRLVEYSRSVSQRLTDGVAFLLKKHNVTVINGEGRLLEKGRVAVRDSNGGEQEFRADHIILATGARPRALPGIEPDKSHIWTYFDALNPAALPRSLLVIGSGAIGAEFASLYNDLGCDVTLVELADQILPLEDREVSALVQQQFAKRGMQIFTGAQIRSATVNGDRVSCLLKTADGEQTLEVDRVLCAAGIQPNIENLGLEALGVEMARGFIQVDDRGRTNVFGLYAIGDVAGAPCLAHKASYEGVRCVEALAGLPVAAPVSPDFIPRCTYTRPQVASLGLTEARARASGREIRVGVFPYQANGKALALGEPQGFVKNLFDAQSGELLGAHMVGSDVTEQIQGFGIAHTLEATEESLHQVIFAHPTLSEAMHEAILAADGRALHQ